MAYFVPGRVGMGVGGGLRVVGVGDVAPFWCAQHSIVLMGDLRHTTYLRHTAYLRHSKGVFKTEIL